MADPSSEPGAPPPPPPLVGDVPTQRLPSEIGDKHIPLCVQHAMLTKDKKPFTYTPGGIDLSQIRSPRMARRIVRNAQSEGVTETPKQSSFAASNETLPPSAQAAMQPQIPIQVFPTAPASPKRVPTRAPPPPPISARPSRLQKPLPPVPQDLTSESVSRHAVISQPSYRPQARNPQSFNTPQSTQTTSTVPVAKLRRTPVPDQNIGSLVIPAVQQMPKLQSPPIPWMNQGLRNSQQEFTPPWVHGENDEANVRPSTTRTVSTQADGRQNSQPSTPQTPIGNKPGFRIVPIKVEGSDATQSQNFPEINQSVSGWGKNNNGAPTQSRAFIYIQQATEGYNEIGPKTRVVPIEYEKQSAEQMRKLQLSEDDKMLMNQFKAHVDEEQFLHKEAEPRFRGAAIPSKAFRVLQTMTGTEEETRQDEGPIPQPRSTKQVEPQDEEEEEPDSPKPYIHPSEQTVPEPKKYTGSHIPGRTFKILQAITEPENYGPGQSDL